MPRALVTGGAGFIGARLVRKLLTQGWRVDVVDDLSAGHRSSVPQEVDLSVVDLSSEAAPLHLPDRKYDALFHLAAQSSGEVSFDDPVQDAQINCLSTLRLLEWCRQRGVPKFIFASSMSVYGTQSDQPVSETAEPNPQSFYAANKLASELYLSLYSRLGVQTTALRLFSVYGPGQDLENMRQGMTSIFLAYVLAGEEIVVKGPLDRFRDHVYVDDVVEAFVLASRRSDSGYRVYNVGMGRPVSVQELIDRLLVTFCKSPDSVVIRKREGTPGDIFGIYAEISRVRQELGWSAKTDLGAGLEQMARWATARHSSQSR